MRKRFFFSIVLIISFVFLLSFSVGAVPELINYQGKLTDATGDALNGNYNMEFCVYDLETGGTSLFHQTAFVNHHNVSASCQTCPGKICFTLFEQYVSRNVGMSYLCGQRNYHNCMKFTSIDGISLCYYHWSLVFWLRPFGLGKSSPKYITLGDYHFSSTSWIALMLNISSAIVYPDLLSLDRYRFHCIFG